ncbi:hypothetical protein SSPO_003560 [Streptomyces antimycoticus]|uniref:Uncharacterized protein n=1 Tax=Streptomyces antimycoticus TaxID=68175 RepID=A0A499UE85_9ACTN|nr:hypothetical protein SSPO_003560 [Streptomyces antimycoticus]
MPPSAAGLVVSVLRQGSAELSSGSHRSSRVVPSPSERQKRVMPVGPFSRRSRRLPAVLSLSLTAAAHNSETVMPSARFSALLVTGE